MTPFDLPNLDTPPTVQEALVDRLGGVFEEMIAELRRLNARLQELSEQRQAGASSVEIKTSTRGVDVSVKAYDNSPIEPVGDAAMSEYARIIAEINQRTTAAINGGTAG